MYRCLRIVQLVMIFTWVSWSLPKSVVFEEFATGLRKPLWMGEVPGKQNVYWILEQHVGVITQLEGSPGKWTKSTVLQLPPVNQNNECGLLGLAFHPNFINNRLYYLNYNLSGSDNTIIEERRVSPDFTKDEGYSRRILEVTQPASNHQGGNLLFGTDGYLYIGMGDGGSGGDPWHDGLGNGQNLTTLLGAMLRIDINKKDPGLEYSIPSDNPNWSGVAGARKEIWAYGLRNPWRYSFDDLTGKLWVGDVGQNTREEITVVGKGENHGWKVMEGFHCLNDNKPKLLPCNDPSFVKPILDYPTQVKINNVTRNGSVTGGYVYRGNSKSTWYGAYFFAEYVRNNLFVLDADKPYTGFDTIPDPKGVARAVTSFARDHEGDLYILSREGMIHKMVLNNNESTGFKRKLLPSSSTPLKRSGKRELSIEFQEPTLGYLKILGVDGAQIHFLEINRSGVFPLGEGLVSGRMYLMVGVLNGLTVNEKFTVLN